MTVGTRYTMVPDIIDALINMFRGEALAAAAALPPDANGTPAVLEVIDGEATTELPAAYVMVGYNAAFASSGFSGSTGLAVEGGRVQTEVGNRQFAEAFTVWCEASTYSGDSDPAALSRQRHATGALISVLFAALEADPTLQNLVTAPTYAEVPTFRWLLDRSSDGVAATVQFGVGIGQLWVPR